jgi:hypothetical protein
MEDKKQEMEKVLKTKTCARGIAITVLEEAKMEADNEGSYNIIHLLGKGLYRCVND